MIALSPKPAALPFLLMGWAVLWAVAMAVPGSPAGTLPCQLAICLPLAAMFGLPHGATDWWLAAERLPARLGAARGRYWALWFSAIYLLGSLAAVALIMVAPALALILFIAGSVWHWGVFDARAHGLGNSPYAWMACALPPIAAPLAFRPHDSALLLHALGVAATPLQIAEAGFAGLLVAAAALTQLRKPPRALGRELAVLLVMCAIAPPLAAFAGYFCLVHSPRQVAALQVRGQTAPVLLVAAAAALLIAVPLLIAIHSGALAPGQAAIQSVFWGLAVLTLPHALCGWLLGAPPPAVSISPDPPKGISV
jgi:Brp/Blh family beta-carotene 15,15'-monooxygenase